MLIPKSEALIINNPLFPPLLRGNTDVRWRVSFKALSIMVFVVLFFTASASGSRDFALVDPEDHAVVETDLIYAVIRVDNVKADTVTVSVNGKQVLILPVSAAKGFLCRPLRMAPGPNEIRVTALLNKEVVQSGTATVFYRSDLFDVYKTIPEGFAPRPFHVGDREKECVGCHRLELSAADVKPSTPSDSACWSCHKEITTNGFVHGPAARWVCLACHDPKSAPQKYVVKQPFSSVCFGCHKDSKQLWEVQPFTHKPVSTGKCTICHNPHSGMTNELLRKKSWDLCVSCHINRATGGHVGAGFTGNVHPTKGKPDPAQPGRELSCASCHDPHAAPAKQLFAYNAQKASRICKVCHKFE
jgi:predicted CXXCH cytochrome family protein